MYTFPYLYPVCSSKSSSNCCFLRGIHISQEAGKVVWYSCHFKNFPHFVLIYTVKSFGIVNKAEIDVLLELSCFPDDPADVGNLILVPLPFLKPAWTSGSSWFTYCWSLAWRILTITSLARALLLSALSQTCYNLSQLKNETKLKSVTSLSHTHSHSHCFWSPLQSCLYSFQFLSVYSYSPSFHTMKNGKHIYRRWKGSTLITHLPTT